MYIVLLMKNDLKFMHSVKNDIIKKSFPGLLHKRIWLVKTKTDDFFMRTLIIPFIGSIIQIDKECFKMPEAAVIGCMAHEIAHVAFPFASERNVDLKVIELGYGYELYALLKYHNKRYEKYNKKDGLTKKEVLKLLAKNGILSGNFPACF